VPRIDCLLLVDSAQVANGKLYILGGGWARLTATQAPISRSLDTAVRVVVAWTETNRPHVIELHLENEDGQALLEQPVKAEIRVGRPASLKDGTDQVVPLAQRLGPVTLEREGRYAVIARCEGEELARTAFDLVVNRPPHPVSG
jgi:hypothetical protein